MVKIRWVSPDLLVFRQMDMFENPCRCMVVTHIGSMLPSWGLGCLALAPMFQWIKKHQWTGSLAHGCEISRRIGRIMANLVKGIDQSVFLRMEKEIVLIVIQRLLNVLKWNYSYSVHLQTWNNARICKGLETLLKLIESWQEGKNQMGKFQSCTIFRIVAIQLSYVWLPTWQLFSLEDPAGNLSNMCHVPLNHDYCCDGFNPMLHPYCVYVSNEKRRDDAPFVWLHHPATGALANPANT